MYSSIPDEEDDADMTATIEAMPSSMNRKPGQENGAATAGNFRAVQIFKPDGGEKYKLDKDALEEMFAQDGVADKPVAVYSLAGAFRHGKSFMLNLFMRFLQFGRSEEWLRNKEEKLNKGFVWRGGKDECTQGIWIWNEPFHVSTKDGEIVIFLMDTQGAFNHETSMEQCSLIFALSTLISSFQIFNVMKQIQGNDLQHLQLFTEYGKLARGKHRGKAFQSLMFLIRDWHDPKYKGLEGGSLVLNDVLKERKKHKELNSVRENIKNSFVNVECMLLPPPGKRVAVRSADSPCLTLEEIDDDFLTEVKSLVHHLFNENIAVKRVNGKVVNGIDLIHFTIAYCEIFESGNLPDVGNIMEACAKAAIQTTIQNCKDEYIRKMGQVCDCENGYVDDENLREFHRQFKEETLGSFDDVRKMGEDSFLARYRQHLAVTIDQHFGTLFQINIAQKERVKNEIRVQVEKAEKNFTSLLEEMSDRRYCDDETLRQMEEKSRNVAFDFYRGSTRKYPQKCVARYEKRLLDLMDQACKSFEETNKYRKRELEEELSQLMLNSKEIYNHFMDQICEGKYVESANFDAAYDKAYKNALNHFDSDEIGNETKLKTEKRRKLISEIFRTKDKYIETNEINRILDEAKASETLRKARDLYNSSMSEACGSGYCSEPVIDLAHAISKSKAEAIIDSVEAEKDKVFADECRSQLRTVLEDTLKTLKSKDAIKKETATNALNKKALLALDVYKNEMDKNRDKYIDEELLEREHHVHKNYALEYFGPLVEPNLEYERSLGNLQRDIQTQFEFLQKSNNANKEQLEARANQVLQEMKAEYMTYMEKLRNGKQVSAEILNALHQQIVNKATDNIRSEIANDKLCNDTVKEYNEAALDMLKNLKDEERKNAENAVWLRNVAVASLNMLIRGTNVFLENASHPHKWWFALLGAGSSLLDSIRNSNLNDSGAALLEKQLSTNKFTGLSSAVDSPSYNYPAITETVDDSGLDQLLQRNEPRSSLHQNNRRGEKEGKSFENQISDSD